MSRCPLFERRALPRSAAASGSSESCGNRGISTADSSCAQITREMTSRSSLKRLWSVSLRVEDEFPAKASDVPADRHAYNAAIWPGVRRHLQCALVTHVSRAKSRGYMHYICWWALEKRVYSSQRWLCDLLAFLNKSQEPVWMCHVSCHLICVAKGFLMLP